MKAVINLECHKPWRWKSDGFNRNITSIGNDKMVESKNHLLVELIKFSTRLCVKSKEVSGRSMNFDPWNWKEWGSICVSCKRTEVCKRRESRHYVMSLCRFLGNVHFLPANIVFSSTDTLPITPSSETLPVLQSIVKPSLSAATHCLIHIVCQRKDSAGQQESAFQKSPGTLTPSIKQFYQLLGSFLMEDLHTEPPALAWECEEGMNENCEREMWKSILLLPYET